MTFKEFLEEKNLTPENTPGSEHALMKEAYEAGYKAGKKNVIEWKKEPPKERTDVLCYVVHNEHRYYMQGYYNEGRWICSQLGTYLNNDEVHAWLELPEVKL